MAKNVMDMSDEELSALSDSEIEALIAEQEAEAGEGKTEPSEPDTEEPNEPDAPDGDDDEPEGEDDPEVPATTDASDTPDENPEGKPEAGDKEPAAKAEGDAGTEADGAAKTEPEKPAERDYKAEVERMLAPFKANGRQIKVDSVEDAIQLMQKGANYHKKMEGIKPRLAQLKLLEQQGLLEGDKLNFIIDLAKGDRGAINRLIKEHGVDTLELDGDKASQYKANDYIPDEAAVELESVLDDLRDSPNYAELLDTVGNKWDNASRNALASKPNDLRDIAAHMESGIFAMVQDQVATERALGRLIGLSSFDAYRTVGDRMYREGKFNGVANTKTPPTPKVAAVVPTTNTKQESDENKKKKLAASPSGKKAPVAAKAEFDPLNMSDEDFLKLSNI